MKTLIMDSNKAAELFALFTRKRYTDILNDLMFKTRTFGFFENKYGHQISYTLVQCERLGLTQKIFDQARNPAGYKLTSKGRHALHMCVKFNKVLGEIS